MARKIHLRGNASHSETWKATCSLKAIGNGMVNHNGRNTYRFMASEVVGFTAFCAANPSDRCAHCVDIGLARRNTKRKEKGWSQVNKIEDAFLEKE